MWPIDCIAHKRDGLVLTDEEIARFIRDYTAGRIADYQAAAWCMAVYLKGNEATARYFSLPLSRCSIKAQVSVRNPG